MTDSRYPENPYQQPAGDVSPAVPQSYSVAQGPTKNHAIAIILSLFFGTLGIDRFYLGHIGLGILKLLLSWLTFGIWQLIDLLLIILRGTAGLRRINWR